MSATAVDGRKLQDHPGPPRVFAVARSCPSSVSACPNCPRVPRIHAWTPRGGGRAGSASAPATTSSRG
eukprot:12308108-Alexandrium_andersonii.AAC.1